MKWVFLPVIFLACAGGHGRLRIEGAHYPVSMSPFLLGKDGRVKSLHIDLQPTGSFEHKKRFWGMLYSWVSLTGDYNIAHSVNEQVEAAGGQGIVNLSIEGKQCAINYFFPLSVLPFWPGCTRTTIRGEIVR